MSVQVVYKTSVKSTNTGVIAVFSDEKFNINLSSNDLSKKETSYLKKILKNKKNGDKIFTINISEKKTVIIILLKKNIDITNIENLGAEFFVFIKKNKFTNLILCKNITDLKSDDVLFNHFLHGLKLKSYNFNFYKTKKKNNVFKILVSSKHKHKISKKRQQPTCRMDSGKYKKI